MAAPTMYGSGTDGPLSLAWAELGSHAVKAGIEKGRDHAPRIARIDHGFDAESLGGLPRVGSCEQALLDLAAELFRVLSRLDRPPEAGFDATLDRHVTPLR